MPTSAALAASARRNAVAAAHGRLFRRAARHCSASRCWSLHPAGPIFAPWIAPQNPYDLAELDVLDGRLPPGTQSAGRLHLLARHRRAGPRHAVGDPLRPAHLARRRRRVAPSSPAPSAPPSAWLRPMSAAASRPAHAHRRPAALLPGDPDRADADRDPRARASTRSSSRSSSCNGPITRARCAARRWRRCSKEYIEAARCLALPKTRIVFRHLLPNCLPPLIVVATVQVAHAIALEATLSFLGVGLPLTEPSLGLLITNGYELPAVGQVLDQLLSGRRAARHHHRHQPRRRPAARRAEPPAQQMSATCPRHRGISQSFLHPGGPRPAPSTASAFTVDRGEVLGLVGESGSGKSVTGFSDPRPHRPARAASSAGRILFEGRDLVGLRRGGAAHAARQAHRHDLPGSDDDAEPGAARRHPDDRGHPGARERASAKAARDRAATRSARSASPRPRTAQRLSAPVLRRHAPARRHRDRPAHEPDLSSPTSRRPRST